jgi:hypothetical protein
MKLTLRQIDAFLQFSDVQQAHQLMVQAVAAQCDGKTIEKLRKELDGRSF